MKKIFVYFASKIIITFSISLSVILGTSFILTTTAYSTTLPKENVKKDKKKKERNERDARAKAERDARAKAERDARAKAERDARAKAERDARANKERELSRAKADAESDINKAKNRYRAGQSIQQSLTNLGYQITQTKKQAKKLRENSLVAQLRTLEDNKNNTFNNLQNKINKINPAINSVKSSSNINDLNRNKDILKKHSKKLKNLNASSLNSLNSYQATLNSLNVKVSNRQAYIDQFRTEEVKSSKHLIKKVHNEVKNTLNSISDAEFEIRRADNLKRRAQSVNAKNIISVLDKQVDYLYNKIKRARRHKQDINHKANRLRQFIRSNSDAWPQDIKDRRKSLKQEYKYFYDQNFASNIDNESDYLESIIYNKNKIIIQMEKELVEAKRKRRQTVNRASTLLSDWYDMQLRMERYLNKLESLLNRAELARMNKNINSLDKKIELSKNSDDKIKNLVYDLTNSVRSLKNARYTNAIKRLIPNVESNYNNLDSEEYSFNRELNNLSTWIPQEENKIAIREAEIVQELIIAKAALNKSVTRARSILNTGEPIFLENTKVSSHASVMLDRANKAYVDSSIKRISDKKNISDKTLYSLKLQTNTVENFLNYLVVASYPTDVDIQTKNLNSYLPNLINLQKDLKKVTEYLAKTVLNETANIVKGEKILAKAQKLAQNVLDKASVSLNSALNLTTQMSSTILKANSMQGRAKAVEKPNIVSKIESFKSRAIKVNNKVINSINNVQIAVKTLNNQRRPKDLDKFRLKLEPLIPYLNKLTKTLASPRLALQNILDKHLSVIVKREKVVKDRKFLIDKANSWIVKLVKVIDNSKILISNINTKTIPDAKKYFKHINSTQKDIDNLKQLSISIANVIDRLNIILKQSRGTIKEYANASIDEIEASDTKKNKLSSLESKLSLESSVINNAYNNAHPLYNKITEHINWRACVSVKNKAVSVKQNMESFFDNHISWNNNGRSEILAKEWMYLYNCKEVPKYQKDVKRLYDFADQNLSAILYELKIKDNLDFGIKYVQNFCNNINIEKLFAEALEDLGGGCDDEYGDEDECDVFDSNSDNIEEAFKQIQTQAFSCKNLKIITK
ncbi:MAG: hypothetical protein HAW60_02235 [Bdellovibrionales bacterium]|nr:hypothetical protein [Bdellovibrionales bacterium]